MICLDALDPALPDPILGLTEAFKADTRAGKVNLSVGVYQNEHAQTPAFRAVQQAERLLLEDGRARGYLPITGSPRFVAATQALVFGAALGHLGERLVSLQAPGGTGALRVAADFLYQRLEVRRAWVSTPTWANHPGVFAAAGLETAAYPYFDAATNTIAFDALCDALRTGPARGEVIILHACCHNPTGADLTATQWAEVASVCAERELLPLLDFAYQGLGDGLAEDTAAIQIFAQAGLPFFVASSYSKNFGLYQDRTGLLSFVAPTPQIAQAVASQLKSIVRTNYSNPPAHGGLVVAAILDDAERRAAWEVELTEMRERILSMRHALVDGLQAAGAGRDFGFLAAQRGMFSFTGLTQEHVRRLREDHAIYLVGSGRINVAGLNPGNIDRVCSAVAAVLKT